MKREIFYSIKTKRVSSKEVCDAVNAIPSNQHTVFCDLYEGGGIWVISSEDPKGLQKKLERILGIELGEPQYE